MTEHTKLPSKRFLVIAVGVIVLLAVLATGFIAGLLIAGGGEPAASSAADSGATENAPAGSSQQMYTCSMHPQVRLPDPKAKCPICFMDLIPVSEGEDSGDGDAAVLSMSEASMKLAEIEVTPVRRELPRAEVRMVGKIDYDETRLATISAYIPGRLDRLFVDYTGISVRKGDHLVSIYSPELLSAEGELLANLDALNDLPDTVSTSSRQISEATVGASREKLRLWGLTPEQIREIEETNRVSDHITIYSPIGGVVISKRKVEGEYVKTGEPIYSIADLTRLWVHLDAYESDLPWIRYGQEVEFTTDAFPGETFHGTISFIDPNVSPTTRTVKLRVNVDNADGRLKPGMFARTVVRPQLGPNGTVIAEDLEGKWVCPMHPEIVKDQQEPCDLCGMHLVRAEELGLVAHAEDGPAPLVIPASAALITGKRAVVYVQLPDRDRPTFEGRRIVLGARAGDYYIVREDVKGGPNLAEGELVVVNGNFKIDSALQIQARSSMMSPPEGETEEIQLIHKLDQLDAPAEFVDGLVLVYAAYLRQQDALANDKLEAFQTAAREMHAAVESMSEIALTAKARGVWSDLSRRLLTNQEHIHHIADLDGARKLFEIYSDAMIELSQRFTYTGGEDVVEAYCPMAFDNKGASWLQVGQTINNPYFGAAMLRCGEVKRALREATPTEQPSEDPDAMDQSMRPVNDICPIMGNPVSPTGGSATWRGHTVGFCCPGCLGPWNEKSDDEKDAFLAKYIDAGDAGYQPQEVGHE